MNKAEEFKKIEDYFSRDTDNLLKKYKAASTKYKLIWDYYRDKMPQCIKVCKNKMCDVVVEGPQGVYWIGNKIKILFVGLENYGWEVSSDFNSKSQEHILYKPLQFAYYDAFSMPNYWAHIKKILYDVIKKTSGKDILNDKKGKYGWDWVLDYIGFTNRCKCFAWSRKIRANLHKNCKEQNFIFKEIENINSPINIMFTLSRSIIDEIQLNKSNMQCSKDIFDSKIWKRYVDGKVFYELHHPTRQKYEVTEKLIIDLIKEIKKHRIKFN